METIMVVNGEQFWPEFLPDFTVVRKRVQDSHWTLRNGRLQVADHTGVCSPDKILWRLGAVRPEPTHESILKIISLSGIPCVNSVQTLTVGYDRLSMFKTLSGCGLPVLPVSVASSTTRLEDIRMDFPFVVKAGNYHGGYGKTLVRSEEQWQDVKDLLFISKDYVSVEPYIEYRYDIRYLAIGENVWAMSRKGSFWKANVATIDFSLITPDPGVETMVRDLQKHLHADVLAVDILEDGHGNLFFLEYNDVPGLSGFPDSTRMALAECVRVKKKEIF